MTWRVDGEVLATRPVAAADFLLFEPSASAAQLIDIAEGQSFDGDFDGDGVREGLPAGALTFTDIRTQGGFAVPLTASASRLFLRDVETGDSGARQVVAWSPGGTAISTLDLGGIEDSLGRKPRHLNIETGVDALVRLDNDRVLIGSGSRLYVVDFPAEQVTPLSAQTPYDPQGSALVGDRLLLGTVGQQWVSTVDLTTLNPESMLLDGSIASFHYLEGPKQIVVTHGDPVGHLTIVDPADPARSTSRVHWGFLLDGALDRE